MLDHLRLNFNQLNHLNWRMPLSTNLIDQPHRSFSGLGEKVGRLN
jgi:hypothetical protein